MCPVANRFFDNIAFGRSPSPSVLSRGSNLSSVQSVTAPFERRPPAPASPFGGRTGWNLRGLGYPVLGSR
jgi:hypothetical protein